jgi:DNA-binding transcriptional regulator YiaG
MNRRRLSRRCPTIGRWVPQTSRRVEELEAKIEQLQEEARNEKKFFAVAVRAERDRLGLSPADYAELVGVSGATIQTWEHEQSKPRTAQLLKWLALRGIDKREAQRRLEHS